MCLLMRYLFCLLMALSGLAYSKTYTVKLGNTKVAIIKQVGRGKTFVHVHENEVTALKAAKLYIAKHGGTLITLKHSGERNIVFHLRGKRYEFDPNRIFTNRGIRRTLRHFGSYSLPAHREVKKLATKIKTLLPKGKIIAVHNNRDYSLKEYYPKHPLAGDARAIHHRPGSNHRNFYFVTQKKEYNRLERLKFNVILQSRKAQDDGSLSYFLARRNYINIEAAYGALRAQLRMLHHA